MFPPFFTQSQQYWKQAVDQHFGRLEAMAGEIGKLEAQAEARVNEAADETARLMKATWHYGREVAESSRKLWLDMTRQAASFGG